MTASHLPCSAEKLTADDEVPSTGEEYTPRICIDVKQLIHSNAFRDYCRQMPRPEIDSTARALLQDLCRFQERQYLRDPIKAKSRRRLVFGLREVNKNLALDKLKCILIAPNIENIEVEGGLNSIVSALLAAASQRSVPIVVALKRRSLGGACRKPVPVSCVGIINYQGSEENFKRLMVLSEQAQQQYCALLEAAQQSLLNNDVQQLRKLRSGAKFVPSESCGADGVSDCSVGVCRSSAPPVCPAAQQDPGHQILLKLKHISVS